MIHIGGKAKTFKHARELAEELIETGAALNKFIETIEYQGGNASFVENYKLLPTAEKSYILKQIKQVISHQ